MSVHVIPLGEVSEAVMGQAPPGADCNKEGKGTVFVKAGEFSDREPLIREWTNNPLKFAKRGDVLVCVVGATAGKINLGIDCAIGRSVAAVRPDIKRLDTGYLHYFLRTQTDRLRSSSQGLAQGVITRDMLSKLEIPLPRLDEQRRIAAILDKADALLRERERAIDLLDSLSRSVFVDLFGEMLVNGAGYPVTNFGELVASQRIGLVRSADELFADALTPYLRMDSIGSNGQLDLRNVKRTKVSAAELAEFELRDGDFLFNTRNSKELVGKSSVYHGPEGYVYNNNILRVRFCPRLLAEYAAAFFQTHFAKSELELRKSGTTSVFAIYQKSLETMPIAVPPLEVQERFVAIVRGIRRARLTAKTAEASLALLFSSLRYRAFCGQL